MMALSIRLRPALLFLLWLAPLWLAPLWAPVSTAALAQERVYPEARYGRGELRYLDGVPVAIFQGSPEEIGAQHAALVLQPGANLLDYPQDFVAAGGA